MPEPEIRPVILGSFGPPALACIRSWGRHGYKPGMVCIRSEEQGLPASRYLSAFASIHPRALYTAEGLETISSFLQEFRASGIIAINEDVSCWLSDTLPSSCKIPVWAPASPIIKSLHSKLKQLEVARRVGFDILPTYLIDSNLETVASIPESAFPLCLRPDDPKSISPTFKVQLINARDDLFRFVTSFERMEKQLVGQPFANLPNLVIHGARSAGGRPIGLHAFVVERKFQGVTLTIRSAELDDLLRQRCIQFVEAFGLIGNYHFEFLLDRARGKTYFLEINGRLGGTTAKVYICGYDEPYIALQSYGICESAPQAVRDCIVSSKHALIKNAIYAIRNKLTLLDYPKASKGSIILRNLYGFLRYRDEVLMLSDIRGSMAFYRTLLNGRG